MSDTDNIPFLIILFDFIRLEKTSSTTKKEFLWDYDGYDRDVNIFEDI